VIRLLLAEDSAVQREFLTYILEESGDFEIVGTAVDGEEAVEMAGRIRPDIILMDAHMPKLDGIAATRIIMETCPVPIVMASATSTAGEVKFTFDAMKSGALAMVSKPPALTSPDFDRATSELTRTLRLMSEVKVVRRWPARASRDTGPETPAASRRHPVRVVGIAGSTGAPNVIAEILTELAGEDCPPLLVVQHIAGGFIEGFALWLAAQTGMDVQMGQSGTLVRRGCAYIAPDGTQMGIDKAGKIVLSSEPEEDGFRPSGSFLLRSLAHAFGSRAMGVLLTGMGRDGVAGLVEVQRAGGVTVVQNEESCVVFGMPREAVRIGAAQHVLPPDGIVQLIKSSLVEPGTPT
jgi:two-component system, chemotaxis family, protein-glutamate methylesterase/glutaminase